MKAPDDFSILLRLAREAARLTVAELAERVGVSRQAVYDLESGKARPNWDTVQRLALVLGVSTESFRDIEG